MIMACESWQKQLDTYLDGELSADEMKAFDAHVRTCSSCAADALARVQMKRSLQVAGKRFAPSIDFRRRIQKSIAAKPQRSFSLAWTLATVAAVLVAGTLALTHLAARSSRDHVFSEIADLHVATLASSSPVDVVSTDRHTVKPWFQGKIPFAFNLPEVQNTEFTLVGGRMTYLDQTPGAQLLYDVRKHHISVFIFQERSVPVNWSANSLAPKNSPFNVETWSQGGLRYFAISDTNPADIDALAQLFERD